MNFNCDGNSFLKCAVSNSIMIAQAAENSSRSRSFAIAAETIFSFKIVNSVGRERNLCNFIIFIRELAEVGMHLEGDVISFWVSSVCLLPNGLDDISGTF